MLLSQSYYFSIISSTDTTLMGAFVQGLLHVLREPCTCNSKVARTDYPCFVIHNVTSRGRSPRGEFTLKIYPSIIQCLVAITNVLNINFVSITRDTGARGPQINKHLKAYLLSNITKYEHNWIIKRIRQGQHRLVTESVKFIQNPSTLSRI